MITTGDLNAISAGLNQISSTIAPGKVSKRDYKYNKQLAQYQYDLNMQAWREQNAYNAPQAQMERLKAAGLNPNLVYGSGAGAAGSAGSPPSYDAPTMRTQVPSFEDKVLPAMSLYQDIQNKRAQEDNIRKQNEVLEQDADLKRVQAILAASQASLNSFNKSKAEALLKYQLDSMDIQNRQNRLNYVLDLAYQPAYKQQGLEKGRVSISSMLQGIEKAKAEISLAKARRYLLNLERSQRNEGIWNMNKLDRLEYDDFVTMYPYPSQRAQYRAGRGSRVGNFGNYLDSVWNNLLDTFDRWF